jgi:hypothetical protein
MVIKEHMFIIKYRRNSLREQLFTNKISGDIQYEQMFIGLK